MSEGWAPELAGDAAGLFSGAEGSRAGALHRLTEAVAWRVPRCCGASGAFWERGRFRALAASSPELAALTGWQFVSGTGPMIAALGSCEPSVIPDTRREERWPEFAAVALAAGVRSSADIVHGHHSMILCLSAYGARPAPPGQQPFPLAPLLAAFGAATMTGAAENIRMRRTAARLQDALTVRAAVDEAKGVLMQALGCDADEALARLRRISQAQQLKLGEAARQVIDAHTRPLEPPGPV